MTQLLSPIDHRKHQERDRIALLPEFDHPEIDAAPVRHLVTLVNPRTEDEEAFEVHTTSHTFCEVYREICHQRVMRGLVGWQIFETLCLTHPF